MAVGCDRPTVRPSTSYGPGMTYRVAVSGRPALRIFPIQRNSSTRPRFDPAVSSRHDGAGHTGDSWCATRAQNRVRAPQRGAWITAGRNAVRASRIPGTGRCRRAGVRESDPRSWPGRLTVDGRTVGRSATAIQHPAHRRTAQGVRIISEHDPGTQSSRRQHGEPISNFRSSFVSPQ